MQAFVKYLDHYARPDNALMVPELGNSADYARFFWPALGKGAIGFAPFGMDATGYNNYPLGTKTPDDDTIAAFGRANALFRSAESSGGKECVSKCRSRLSPSH